MTTVLVVDDDPGMRMIASRYLQNMGCEVLEAINGSEGEHTALAQNPDLILLDIMMPVQDGHDTCTHLREKGYTGAIILTSTLHTTLGTHKAMEYGANGCAQKPITRDLLKSCLGYVGSQ
jgi:two-component system response regulator YcbB